MTKLRSLALLLMLSAGCWESAAEREPAEDAHAACAHLRDHLVDLDLENVSADRDAHRAALEHALGDGFVDECAAHRSPASVMCASHAGSLEVAARCEGSPASAEVTP